jgi:LPXTG-motif cell wall-anchored protein
MHPNAAGVSYLASQLQDAVRAELTAPVVEPEPAGELLPATGTDSAGWITLSGLALLVLGGLAMSSRRTALFRR